MLESFYNYQGCAVLRILYKLQIQASKQGIQKKLDYEQLGMSKEGYEKVKLFSSVVKSYPKFKYLSWSLYGIKEVKNDIVHLLNRMNKQFKPIQDFWAKDYDQVNHIMTPLNSAEKGEKSDNSEGSSKSVYTNAKTRNSYDSSPAADSSDSSSPQKASR